MTETVEQRAHAQEVERREPCLCESFARATERSALAAARWLGRDDPQAAEEAATSGMARTLDNLPIEGRVAIGGEDDGALAAAPTTSTSIAASGSAANGCPSGTMRKPSRVNRSTNGARSPDAAPAFPCASSIATVGARSA